jgi:hypothetical protein
MFPPTLFVREEADPEEEPYYIAETAEGEAIYADGPTAVAVYELKEVRRLAKRVVEILGDDLNVEGDRNA